MIPVYKPYFPKGSLHYAHDAIDSTWVSSQGKYLQLVKDWLADYYGTEYIILTSNGTTANHLMARAIHKKYPDRKNLICPNNSYVAAWNPFLFDNMFELSPIDAHEKTWNMNYNDRSNMDHRTNVFLAVHNLGNIVNVPFLKSELKNTIFIEDNCEGFGGWYENDRAGAQSEAFTLSFFGNKNVTAGEGGAFITYDEDLYNEAFLFWGQGTAPDGEKFIHADIGHNYRMTNVEAAILLGQLEILEEIEERKEQLFYTYKTHVGLIEGAEMQMRNFGTRHSNWMFGVKFPKGNYYMAKKFFEMYGIETRPMFYPITAHGHLKNLRTTTDVAAKLAKEVVIFPSYPNLLLGEIGRITGAMREYAKELSVL
jgi:perosamine synthetase